ARNAPLGVELLVVAQINYEGRLIDQGRIAQPRADGIDAAFKRTEQCTCPRVARELAPVVADDANDEPLPQLIPHRPLEMHLVTAEVIGLVVLEVEVETHGAIKLQLCSLVLPSERPAGVNGGTIEADNGKEARLIFSGRRHSLHPEQVREIAVLPAELKPRGHVADA